MNKLYVFTILALTMALTSHPDKAFAQTSSPTVTDNQDALAILDGLDIGTVRESLLNIWSHGLNPAVYWSPTFERAYVDGSADQPVIKQQILSSYLKALKDIAGGVTNPQGIASDIKIKKKDFLSLEQLRTLTVVSGGRADVLLEQVAPRHSLYMGLRESMRKLYPLFFKGGWERISPINKPLALGSRHPVVIKIKERLKIMGYSVNSTDDVFDNEVVSAINDIQASLRIKPDGKISPGGKTWGYFWTYCGERIRQIQADMEKLRWLPQQLEDRHIFVNTAFSHFYLTDKAADFSLSFKTINGTKERKTPTIKDRINYLVFNPTWTVPPTVFINDKVEAIKNLDSPGIRDYFERNNFQVYTSDFSKTIDPTSINWRSISSANVDFYIRQKPHYMNALGIVKFPMTNPYAIYLHDTNQRELFSEAQRLRSSGCVRLEKPLDLAEYLLKGTDWTRAKIDDFTAEPGEIIERETRVNLKSPIPVYLIPVTSQMNSDGVIRFVDDSYGHNQLILNKVRGIGK